MTNGDMNRWLSRWVRYKGAIAFYLYLLFLLLLAVKTHLYSEISALPTHVMVLRFILLGVASYLGYWGMQQRTVWIWRWQIPLGPLLVAILASLYEAIQIAWFKHTAGLANLAAGFSGVVLFYRLARARATNSSL